jgi:ubiquitin-protein ligase
MSTGGKSTKASSRIINDYINARVDGAACGFDIRPVVPDQYDKFYMLFTPKAGVYKGQQYILYLSTNWEGEQPYPIGRPLVKFINSCFHVNVGSGGHICVTFLNSASEWVPTYTFSSILQSISVLFDEPNPSSPMNSEAGRLWNQQLAKYQALKPDKMSEKDREAAYNRVFEPFTEIARQTRGSIKDYVKWFPQLDMAYYEKHILEISAELEEFEEMAAGLKAKHATPAQPQPAQQAQAAQPIKAPKWAAYQKK